MEFSCLSTRVNNIRLWTIEDAKDGDVLVASDSSILLFKCVVDAACKHYIALTTDNAVKFNEGLEHYWETSSAVHPATKEQRDLLFQKMKEAGYDWDAEKKELKKIEQNPAWSEKDEEMLNRCIEYTIRIVPVKAAEDSGLLVDFKRTPDEKAQDWLKSLKSRVQPQWKPSDEQIKAIQGV